MAEKIATREAYGNALAEFGEKYDFVVLDADLAAATKTGVFKKKFPERFFDCGIAEGNIAKVEAKGILPAAARPAATLTILPSAIPQSKNLSGNFFLKTPVLVAAARSASSTTKSYFSPNSASALP